ncbi:hypothetical protein [Acidiluteibacter ferrifornacis]|uniref:Uncharacterized protein n=1 Tax=Acidiluteibacter ferrifornacis TaxID=2692424 RepID=A0A6N9NKU3_9FLAO|nr:hypothetical protein [Acidiluteibacter ferrifornacis]NBG66482.1 hypothetical protein [Acidiluteibacter ferrifornacis]
MKIILKNILAVVIGLFVGATVNMGLINISGSIIPPPAGADTTTMEGLKAAMELFEAKHFIFPFLAHALGTLVGALLAALIAGSHQLKFAMVIGVFFLIGGITMVFQVPSPLWFNVLDLGVAYLPMAWIGWKITGKGR